VETTLDLDMLSALCPKCHITVVEANDEQLSSLFQAEQAAMAVSPSAVSNSWGSAEFAGEQNYDSWFTPPDPKTLVLFSVGDLGYAPGPEYPATSPNVVSVGGTVLNHAKGSSGWVQSVWSGTQSGCSLYEPKPAWQSPLVPSCDHRMAADVSAVATNVAVYDTYLRPGWMTASGTSISVAVIAALETLAGGSVTSPAKLYSTSGAGFFDVKAGGDGNCGSSGDPTYALCHAVGGYDAPTGRGAPYGISGLTAH
jgi:subtilase family serine protease